MEITEERVIAPVRAMQGADAGAGHGEPLAEARLRALIRLHLETVLRTRDREITVMLHENHPLSPEYRGKINERKKNYVKFVEALFADVHAERAGAGKVSPRAGAFALLGMINWIYQWYKPGGPIGEEELIREYTDMVFGGAFGR